MGHILSHPITSKNLQRKGNKHFKIGSAEMQGFRVNMEDTHAIETVLDSKKHPLVSFFGIYDGHAGTAASEFCAASMHKRVALCADPTDGKQLIDSVLKADEEFLKNDENSRAHGSTSVFAIVKPKETKGKDEQKAKEWLVTVANVGDSRAILIRADGSLIPLTEDHKPDLPKEKERIEAAGGSVSMNRVDGQLAMSRAIGDWTYKNNSSRTPEEQKVIAVPEIRTVTAEPNDMLLIACDGIFEQMTNEDVCALVHSQYQEQADKKDPALVAAALLDQSLRKGSKDNHSAMIIVFEDGADYEGEDEFMAGPFNPYASDRQFRDAYLKDALRFGISQEKAMELAAKAEKDMNLTSPPFSGGGVGGGPSASRGPEDEDEDQGNPAAIRITQEQLMTLTQLPEMQKLLFLKALIQSQVGMGADDNVEAGEGDEEPAEAEEESSEQPTKSTVSETAKEKASSKADRSADKPSESKMETSAAKDTASENPKSTPGKGKKKKKKNKNKKK